MNPEVEQVLELINKDVKTVITNCIAHVQKTQVKKYLKPYQILEIKIQRITFLFH
jgi:flavoprotein